MKPEKFDPEENNDKSETPRTVGKKKSRHARRKNHPKTSLRDPSKTLP